MFNTQKFLSDTEFEQYALAQMLSVGRERQSAAELDLREGNLVRHSGEASVYSSEARRQVAPLLGVFFGVTWKVLDLLIEETWRAALRKPPTVRVTIADKVVFALGNAQALVAVLHDRDVAERIIAIYANTKGFRHSVTHNKVDLSNGVLTVGSVSMDNQTIEALSRFTMDCVDVISAGRLLQRTRADIAYWANQLNALHGLSAMVGASPFRMATTVVVNAERLTNDKWSVDTEGALRAAKSTFKTERWFDIKVHFPGVDAAPSCGHLDAAPIGAAIEVRPLHALNWTRG